MKDSKYATSFSSFSISPENIEDIEERNNPSEFDISKSVWILKSISLNRSTNGSLCIGESIDT